MSFHGHRGALAGALLLALNLAPVSLYAQVQPSYAFDLPPQTLADSLHALGSTAAVNVIFEPAIANGRNAPALKGSYSVHEALNVLLRESELTWQTTPAGAFVIETASAHQTQGAPPHALGPTEPRPPAADNTPPDENATQLDAITVTAQSRPQELQLVPISLSVVTDKQIENLTATDLSQVSAFIPGLGIDAFDHTQPSFKLRGISTGGFGLGIDQAVGVYVNGVYQPRGGGSLLAFNDVQRVEVLKGPQGTLFGRNTSAGAISIVTNEPGLSYEANARVRLGNYRSRYGDALVNLPVGENYGLRIGVLDNRSDGWKQDASTGRHYFLDRQWGARMALGGELSDNWKLLLSWDHDRINEPQRLQIGVQPYLSNTHQRASFPPQPSQYLDPREVPVYQDAADARMTKDYDGTALTVTGSFDWGTLISTTALARFDLAHVEDQDGTNNRAVRLDSGVTQDGKTYYQEFKFAGANDRFDWVAGASFYREHGHQSNIAVTQTDAIDTLIFNQGVVAPGNQPVLGYIDQILASFGMPLHLLGNPYREQIDNEMTSKSYAAFGDVIWHLNERLNLISGLRYTRDDKTFSWHNQQRSAAELDAVLEELRARGVLPLIPPAVVDLLSHNIVFRQAQGELVTRQANWSNWSPRAVLDYHFTPTTMGYVSVTRGYKAGGFDGVQINSQYAPEIVWNYELGIKNTFPELNMMLNASLYHYKYSNRQSLALVPASGVASIPQYTVQSSNQNATGLDVDWLWKPSKNLTLNLSGAYIDSTYGMGAEAPDGADLSGQPTGGPRLSLAAGATYAWHLPTQGDVQLNVQHAYRGKTRCNVDSQLQGACGEFSGFEIGTAQQQTNARLGWSSSDRRWGAALFVNNLLDKQYVDSIGSQAQSVLGVATGNITAPRTYGIEFNVKFL